MDRFVANLNIVHFRKQLAEETDETKRLMLVRLLAEEEAKLAGLPSASHHKLGRLTPLPPVGRTHFDPLRGFCLGPSAEHATAGEHERVWTIPIDHGKFQIAVERRGGDWFPHQS